MKLLLLALMTLAACRSGVGPMALATEGIQNGVTQGFDASNDVGPTPLRVRYNPAKCDCPPYEVFAFGRWIRTFVDIEGPVLEELRGQDSLAVSTVVATVQARQRVAGNGVKYRVVAAE